MRTGAFSSEMHLRSVFTSDKYLQGVLGEQEALISQRVCAHMSDRCHWQ